MKKLIYGGVLLLSIGTLFGSCEKEEIQPAEQNEKLESPNKSNQSEEKTIENALFRLNENEGSVKMVDVKSSDETHFFYQFEGENYAFDNDISFLNWASKSDSRAIFIEKYNFYKAQQQMAIETGMIDDEEATQRYTDELIANSGAANDRLTLSILYDNQNYTNVLLPVVLVYPTMGGQKNRAESMGAIINAGALCDRTWFRGDKFWYNSGLVTVPSLGTMNNRAESIF